MSKGIINQPQLNFANTSSSEKVLVNGFTPYYTTDFGAAYLADSYELLKVMPDNSVDLVLTSPPYALQFKKEYGN